MSSFSVSGTDTSDLTSTTDATTPLYDGIYIITYTKSSDTFKYVKKKVGNGNSYSPKTVSTTLKYNGNVCLFQMIYLSSNYYYSAWIDRARRFLPSDLLTSTDADF